MNTQSGADDTIHFDLKTGDAVQDHNR